MKLNLITLGLVGAVVAVFLWHARELEWTAVRMVGAAIAGVSLGLLVLARIQLGASFSIEAKARRLVTTGLYSKMRNPIYVFGELCLVGVAMIAGRWQVLLWAAVVAPLQIYRARKEERVLADAFGEEYARYKAGTWF